MSTPKISIIIPVYKTEEVVGRCIESIQNQKFQDFEIILVNDYSPDNAMSVIKKYMSVDNRIKVIEHDTNKGPMIARQEGVNIAEGQYFIFLDSDDTLSEGALEILLTEIESSNSDIVISGSRYIWPKTNKTEERYPKIIGEFSSKAVFYKLLDGTLNHNLAFCIFNSELFRHEYLTIPDQKYGEDLIMFYQLVGNSKKIKSVKHITYNYYQYETSSSHSNISIRILNQFVNVHNFKIEYLKSKGIEELYILKNIVPMVLCWNSHNEEVREILSNFNPCILNALNLNEIFNYVSKIKFLKILIKKFWLRNRYSI